MDVSPSLTRESTSARRTSPCSSEARTPPPLSQWLWLSFIESAGIPVEIPHESFTSCWMQDDPLPEGIRAYPGFDGLLDQDASQEARGGSFPGGRCLRGARNS